MLVRSKFQKAEPGQTEKVEITYRTTGDGRDIRIEWLAGFFENHRR